MSPSRSALWRPLQATFGAIFLSILVAAPAGALSQIPDEEGTSRSREGIISVPLPPISEEAPGSVLDPAEPPQKELDPAAGPDNGGAPADDPVAPLIKDQDAQPPGEGAPPARPPEAPPLPVRYGDEGLSGPARDVRARLIEIARAGEIEALRPYLETGPEPTALSVVPLDDDPIEFLKQASGDGEGVEILAILLEVLLAGHVHLEEGGADEIFIWPYFTQVALDRLTKPQLVELFKIVTAGDYQTMLGNGAYDFYRVGISPDGRLEFFLAGD